MLIQQSRFVLMGVAVFTVLFNLGAELNATHVWNETIEPHARFHIVWQLACNVALSAYVVWMLAAPYPSVRHAAMLLSIEPTGFVFAALTRATYGGTYFPANVPEYDIQVLGVPVALAVFLVTLSINVAVMCLTERV